ncbi:MAG: N-acetyltransferase family protein [Roseobacter sp.]
MSVSVYQLDAQALSRAIPAIAALRMAVFREWPYLYDGDLSYEETYLQPYLDNPNACIVGAFDRETLVGAATATPLRDHADDFAQAFAGTGHDIDTLYYCAESVLLPAYRGQGIGHRFFDIREQTARGLGYRDVCFASVIRPQHHPSRPRNVRTLDSFWRRRGYAPLAGVVAEFRWKDLGEDEESPKPLQVWHRTL